MPTPIVAAGTLPITGPAAAAPAATSAAGSAPVDKDMFLKLMVAQLRFQNPLEPTDGSAFMAQTAQFTMVETLQTLADSQASSLRWARMSAAQAMVGQPVEATDTFGSALAGTVTAVRATGDGPMLTVTDTTGTETEVPLDAVTAVRAAAGGGTAATGTTPQD